MKFVCLDLFFHFYAEVLKYKANVLLGKDF